MNKTHTAFYLNGPNKGKEVVVQDNYTVEEEQALKDKMKLTYDGKEYAGYCRRCGLGVKIDEAKYQSNTNAYGTLSVDVFHRWCL